MIKLILKVFFISTFLCCLIIGCNKSSYDIEIHPEAGKSFLNIENEGFKVSLEAIEPPQSQIGVWRVYSGEHGRFEDENDPKSVFYGEPGEIYLLGWEVSHGGDYKVSEINVSFKPLSPVVYSNIGDTIHNNISMYLEAKAPQFGATGKWEIIDGGLGSINYADSSDAQFIGVEDERYTLRWSLSYGSKKEYQEFSFRTDTLRAQAGDDRLDVVTSSDEKKFCNMEGYLPAGATGRWRIIKGSDGIIHSANHGSSIFEAVADTTYALEWAVQLGEIEVLDTVQIRFRGKWGMWTDQRDGQSYRYTEVDGKQWMADNFNYAYKSGAGSWYYGHAERSVIKAGHALESEQERKLHGRLYTWQEAYEATPEGWRLPTNQDITDLLNYYGGAFFAGEALLEGGKAGTEFIYSGFLDLQSSGDVALRNVFDHQDILGIYWTGTYDSVTGLSTVYSFDVDAKQPGGGYYPPGYTACSVRYIRDIK